MNAATTPPVIDWLLAADPAIRWQVLRDLVDATPAEVAAERRRVADEGWGARILDLQWADGSWSGGACFPKLDAVPEHQPWTATMWALRQLWDCGVDPADPRVRDAVDRVAAGVRWEYDGEPYFDGEVEPCINGQTVGAGSYFGRDVDGIARRLVGETMADGGWNCDQERGSVRSSFDTTISVLEGMLAYERAPGSDADLVRRSREVRASGAEYLLRRHLLRRASTGEVVDPGYLELRYPPRWHYDVLRALDHFRDAGIRDDRLAEAVQLVRAKADEEGRWALEGSLPGDVLFELEEGDGRPSRWNTLRALRVLRWWDERLPG
ncbi:MAG: hypothetical protein HY996_12025 [Micrococcales bacterium]|nr:hypothetical protein [Micrococcales bacterium]